MPVSLALIPLNPNPKLDPGAIVADFASKWPDLDAPSSLTVDEGRFTFDIGEDSIIAGHMPAPIPWSDLEGPCKTSLLWQNAKEELANHNAHLIVTVLSERGPIERSTLLTQACASILATCEQAPGIYWGNAAMVISSGMFQEFATDVLPEGLRFSSGSTFASALASREGAPGSRMG